MSSTTLSSALIDSHDTVAKSSTPRTTESAHGDISRKRLWTGRILTGLAGLFLLFDASMKLFMLAPVVKGTAELGYPASTILPMGIILLGSTLLYLVPRTAFYGALLLTGYLGGAIASHLRLGHPLFSHTLFPIYVAVMIWAGLALRDRRLEAIIRQPRA
jgi:ABC-type transport system involved in cytochrome c biogenesis permease component